MNPMLDDTLWQIFDLATIVFEVITLYYFLRDVLGKKEDYTKYYLISFSVFAVILYGMNVLSVPPEITISIVFLCSFLLGLLFNGINRNKIFIAAIFCALVIVTEMLVLYSIMWITGSVTEDLNSPGAPRFMCMIVSKLLLLIMVRGICIYNNRKNHKSNFIPVSYWIALFFIPVFNVIITYIIFSYNKSNASIDLSVFSLVASLGVLYSTIVMFFLFDSVGEKAMMKIQLSLLQQQNNYQLKHYKELEMFQVESRHIYHDMKNHFICIENFIDCHQYDNASNYINKITEIIKSKKPVVTTHNPVIDSLLNAKISIAQSYGILVSNTIELPSYVTLEPIDISIIIGNSFDNAIEACNRVIVGDKTIHIILAYKKGVLYYNILNTTNGHLLFNKGRYLTSKKDKSSHGLGLVSIQNVVDKYNGSMEINHNNNMFDLSLTIYINNS